jgi:hypothetical protein
VVHTAVRIRCIQLIIAAISRRLFEDPVSVAVFNWNLMCSKGNRYDCRKEPGRKRSWPISIYCLTFHLRSSSHLPKVLLASCEV